MALGLIIGIRTSGEEAAFLAHLDSLPALQHAVDGLIGLVPSDPGVTIFCNDEGRIEGRPVNHMGNLVFENFDRFGLLAAGQPLVGSIVVLGPPDRNGDNTDVPDFVKAMVGL